MVKLTNHVSVLYAFLAVETDGSEGITSMKVGDTWMPMVFAYEEVMMKMKVHAKGIQTATGKKIKIVKFSNREDLGNL